MKTGKINLLVGIHEELQETINFLEEKNREGYLGIIGMVLGIKMSQRVLYKYHVGWPEEVENYDPEKFDNSFEA